MTKEKVLFEEDLVVTKQVYYNEDNNFGVYGFKFAGTPNPMIDLHPIYRNFSIAGNIQQLAENEKYTVVFYEGFDERRNMNAYFFEEVKSEGIKGRKANEDFLKAVLTEKQALAISKQAEFLHIDELVKAIANDEIDISIVKGIGESHKEVIKNKLKDVDLYSEAIIKLAPVGVGINSIISLVNAFGDAKTLLQKVNSNIYSLTKVKGFGFKTIDEYAMKLGYKENDPKRIRSGAFYVIDELVKNGDTKIRLEDFSEKMCTILNIEDISDDLFNKIINTKGIRVDSGFITLQKYYDEEKEIAYHLRRIRDNFVPTVNEEAIEKSIIRNQVKQGFTFNKEQREAIYKGAQNGVFILDGKGGSGKCIDGNSLVLSEKGMIKIKDFPKHFDLVEEKLKAEILSVDTLGSKNRIKTSHWYNMGVQPTKEIKTNFGRFIEGTHEHPLLTVTENGDFVFKEIKDINVGDVIVSTKGDRIFGDNNLVSPSLAYAFGVMTGDGSMNGINHKNATYSIILTNSTREIYEEYSSTMIKNFNIKMYKKEDGNTYNHIFSNKKVHTLLMRKYGIKMCHSRDKEIPEPILTAPQETVSAFLQGMFDTDGSMTKTNKGNRYGFEFSTASKTMYEQIQSILLNFGIVTNGRIKKINGVDYYVITISSKESKLLFNKYIGFKNHPEKVRRLQIEIEALEEEISNPNKITAYNMREKIIEAGRDLVKNHGWSYRQHLNKLISTVLDKRIGKNGRKKDLSLQKLEDFIKASSKIDYKNKEFLINVSNLFFDVVQEIKDSEAEVFDFTVPVTHSFVANGFVNHNTAGVKTMIDSVEGGYRAVCLSGKAANVLAKNGLNASTIHRALIEIKVMSHEGGTYDYQIDYDNTTREDPLFSEQIIILDEASMVDNGLFLQILRAIPNGHQIAIVGDSGQLPAIGRGAIFDYLLSATEFAHVTLTQVHRQAQDSGTLEVANKVREGKQFLSYNADYEKDGVIIKGNNKDFYTFAYQNKTKILPMFIAMVERYINNPDKNNDDLQIITGLKERGDLSVANLNKLVQPLFNPSVEGADEFQSGKYTYRKGDRVIQQGNNYKATVVSQQQFIELTNGFISADEIETTTTEVFNGTFGKIVDCVQGYGLLIQFEDTNGLVYYHKGEKVDEIKQIDLGYAISCHRSQGSGFKDLFVVVTYNEYMLLSKQFLYTALTRTIDNCFLFCETKAVAYAVKTDKGKTRNCYLGDFIK